ncbi:hypothetical protein [Mycobacterium uberis]
MSSVHVGDRVVAPFQISCGNCCKCRCSLTGLCGSHVTEWRRTGWL